MGLAKISLAWLQLKHQRMRLLTAIAGISFAVILMFMQLGFQAALFDSAVLLHHSLRGDIFLLSPRSTALIAMRSFSERRLYQALALNNVEFITPIYLGFAQWKNPTNPLAWRNIHIIGFDTEYPVFDLPGVKSNVDKLNEPDVVLFDEASRPEFGPVTRLFQQGNYITTEIDNMSNATRQVKVVGLFKLGTTFGIDGNLITSHVNFLRIFSRRQKGLIEVGVIKLKSGINSQQFKQELQQLIPNDVKIFTKQEWIDFEKQYWMTSTAIGFIFTLGVGMGLIVGIVVVYQILYTDVSDHLKEYATLTTMGYKHRYFLTVILQESIILACLGYIPGFLISSGLYIIAYQKTLLPIAMTHNRTWFVFLLTVFMCFIAGIIAIRKLQDVDPADIF
ncbi:ABC transporter permease DevC [Crocosphaera sp. XPORK-15E]|uniref:ABC transporter permease DevC n=1 Tax=Crocosphaera sp. XPORK-15E TaxID=3110247 RepID=UPI002B1EAF12|nr:ABC transporter permease DevC [Crocosphaera sp. XPORK-15E]MEA5532425.1 ABC transporter permease DevC [Crocosphaera sp. XPORK-15E]